MTAPSKKNPEAVEAATGSISYKKLLLANCTPAPCLALLRAAQAELGRAARAIDRLQAAFDGVLR